MSRRFQFAIADGLLLTAVIAATMYFHDKGEQQYISGYRMHTDELAGWGARLLVGAFVAYRAFLSNPPPKD